MRSGSNLGRLAGTTCWLDLLSPTTYYTSVYSRQGVDRGLNHLDSMPNTLDHPPDHPESGSTDALW